MAQLKDWGPQVLSNMLYLRELLLSDEPLYAHLCVRLSLGADDEQILEILQGWTTYCPTLETAAFTSISKWQKEDIGWVKYVKRL